VDWLASFIALRVAGAVFVVFPRRWRKNLHNSPANGKQGSIPEEIYQTLLTNKKHGNAANIIKPTQTRINREKSLFTLSNQWIT
jgi:hypothetical protein